MRRHRIGSRGHYSTLWSAASAIFNACLLAVLWLRHVRKITQLPDHCGSTGAVVVVVVATELQYMHAVGDGEAARFAMLTPFIPVVIGMPAAIGIPAMVIPPIGRLAVHIPPVAIAMPPLGIGIPPVAICMPPVGIAMPPAVIAMPAADIAIPPGAIAIPPAAICIPPVCIGIAAGAIDRPDEEADGACGAAARQFENPGWPGGRSAYRRWL